MADEFKPGDHVTWNTSRGVTEGTVERKLTGETHIKGFTAKPSAEHPEYLVKSDKSGKEAAHKPEELQRAGGRKRSTAAKRPAARKAVKRSAAKKTAGKKTAAKSARTRKTAKKTASKRGPSR